MFTDQERTLLAVMVFLYFLFLVGVAYTINRRVKTYEQYSIAARSVSVFPMVLTLIGTAIGGSILLGYMTDGYRFGMGQVWLGLVMVLPTVLMGLFMMKPIRRLGAERKMITIGDYTAFVYGEKARIPTALSVLVAYCAITGMQFVAIATILSFTTGLSMTAGILISWAMLTVKTYLGGLKSVVFQDALHGTVQCIGIFALFTVIILASGGWGEITAKAEELGQAQMLSPFNIGATELAVLFLTLGAYQVVRQDLWQRFWAAESIRTLRASFWTAISLQTVLCVIIVAIGVMARFGLEIDSADPTLIYYEAASAVFPFPLVAVMVLVVLATVISCADSFFLAGSASIVNDIVRPRLKNPENANLLKISKVSVLCTSVVACLLALYIPRLVDLWITGTAMLVSGILAPVVIGLFWKGVKPLAGVISMWGGLGTAVTWQLLGHPLGIDPVFVGLPLSIVLLVGLSLVSPTGEGARSDPAQATGHPASR